MIFKDDDDLSFASPCITNILMIHGILFFRLNFDFSHYYNYNNYLL